MRLSVSSKWLLKSISTCDTIVGGPRRASGDMAVYSEHNNQESTCITCVHGGTSGTCWLARSLASISTNATSLADLVDRVHNLLACVLGDSVAGGW
jgi:hypothetical protein